MKKFKGLYHEFDSNIIICNLCLMSGALEMQSLRVVQVDGDGNCLFRAVAHQIYGKLVLHLYFLFLA